MKPPGDYPKATLPRTSMYRHYQHLARFAERGKLDSVFLADSPVLWNNVGRHPAGGLEPTDLLTALAARHRAHRPDCHVVHHLQRALPPRPTLRLAGPHQRRPGGLEHRHLRGPEAEARNFGIERPPHSDRYARAAEFLEVARSCGTAGRTTPRGRQGSRCLADTEGSTPSTTSATHFQVAGPLNVPRSPQGHPLLVQAGSSEDGKDFAARFAEAVFTAQQTLDDARCSTPTSRTGPAYGRLPTTSRSFPASRRYRRHRIRGARAGSELDDLIRPEYGKRQLSDLLGWT